MGQRIDKDRTVAGLLLIASVAIAIVFPAVAKFFAPFMLPSLFMIIVFSLLPFGTNDSDDIFKVEPVTFALVFWMQFIVPLFVLLICRYLGLSHQLTLFSLITATAGTLFASPTIVQLLNLDSKVAVQSVILSTLATPVSLYFFVAPGLEHGASLNMLDYIQRVTLFLVLPLGMFLGVRSYLARQAVEVKEKINSLSRWGAVVALSVFGIAIMDQVDVALLNEPGKVVLYLTTATIVSVGAALTTTVVLSSFGRGQAYTGAVLTGFRNVGLSLALIGDMAGPDLALYVGVSQIPVFIAPLLFDVFLERKQRSISVQQKEQNSWDDLRMALTNIRSDLISEEAGSKGLSPRDHGSQPSPQPSLLNAFGASGTFAKAMPVGATATASLPGPGAQGQNALSPAMPVSVGATALAMPEPETSVEVLPNPDLAKTSPEHAIHLIQRLHDEHAKARKEAELLGQKDAEEKQFGRYAFALIGIVTVLVVAVWEGNKILAPMLYDKPTIEVAADALSRGQNFAIYDLNIDIRNLRNATIAKMDKAPELVLLGASQWQEAHANLLPQYDFFNAHIHRDYYEDMLAMVEMFVRHDKLPKEMIITLRDNLFTPVAQRTDFLWLPGIPYYRAMARRIGLEPHSIWETLPIENWRNLVSLPLLVENYQTQSKAIEHPRATTKRHFQSLDTLLPGGSIIWSKDHQTFFSQKRATTEALSFALKRRKAPPVIDPEGAKAIDVLLGYLQEKGVKVTLARTPFNPIFWDAVSGSPFMDGLKKVEDLTQSYATKYGLQIIGSYNPREVGCKSYMYIDAEHSSPDCIGRVLQQYAQINGASLRSGFTPKFRQTTNPMGN